MKRRLPRSRAAVLSSVCGSAALTLLAACAAAPPPAPESLVVDNSATAPQAVSGEPETDYRLQIGDEVDVRFVKTPELNITTRIRPDGMITVQLLNDVSAVGLRPTDLARQLEQQYATELRQPRISVALRSFGAQRVYIGGEVTRPGAQSLESGLTALQAIQQAGGFKDTASTKYVLLIRAEASGKRVARELDLDSVTDGEDLDNDLTLQPLDIVFVPRSRIAEVNVFVDQYLRKMIPVQPSVGMGLGVF